jgi:hypothetical protein
MKGKFGWFVGNVVYVGFVLRRDNMVFLGNMDYVGFVL